MMKNLRLILAGGLLFAAPAAFAQDTPPPPAPPAPPEARVWSSTPRGSYLGITLDEVDEKDQERLRLAEPSGALIRLVSPGSPAADAGLRENDVVVGFNGTRVENAGQLSRLVRETPAGRAVTLDVMRDGHRTEIEAKVGQRTAMAYSHGIDLDSLNGSLRILRGRMDSLGLVLGDSLARIYSHGAQLMNERFMRAPNGERNMLYFVSSRGRLGVELQSLTPQLAKFFGAEKGVLISSVADSGAARTAGLLAGDIVIAVDGNDVTGPRDVTEAMKAKEEGTVELRIIRDRREQTIRVTLPKKSGPEGGFNFNGNEFHFFNDGQSLGLSDGHGETRIFRFDSSMFPELPELPELPAIPETEFENLPEGDTTISNR
jgi:serine protease Do